MLPSSYEHKKYEDKIYKKWEESGAFTPDTDPNKKPFTISMPPPNATGTLHLGHAVMLALEDIMIRQKRMQGYNALWLPGTDHAAIATQNKVEKILAAEEGITREQLGRENFLERVKAYVADCQDTIRQQVRKMGSSCDWTRERYTFDDDLNRAVTEIFVRMYEDKLIYRGHRLVNWCPRCKSTLADDEVEHKERQGKLYWIKYGPFVLATTRPETKLGDTAVAVHPDDERYKDMVGKEYQIPGVLGEFTVKVIADKSVNPEFGSGAVKVTPAHSFVDNEMAERNGIPMKQIIDEDGCMMENCGKYAGLPTVQARKEIVEDMEKMGLIEKVEENYDMQLSVCYRCETPIEPLPSKQWFIDVNQKFDIAHPEKLGLKDKNVSLKEAAIHVIKDQKIEIIPDRFNKTYFHWMDNLKDWCVSRQIWWGHRIPVWYCEDCEEVIVDRETPKACKCGSEKLIQDEDTLDTWFSSGLWTFSTLGWPEKTEDLEYFHPTSVMETGYDILFFWVARMIIMSTYALSEIPFEKVYLHGLLRDKQGRKMSKSLGNGIDPLEMIDKYGADALRMALFIGSTPGNDSRIYEEKIEGFRNFVNKFWNISRFALGRSEDTKVSLEGDTKGVQPQGKQTNDSNQSTNTPQPPQGGAEQTPQSPFQGEAATKPQELINQWIISRTQVLIKDVNKGLDEFKFSETGQLLYDFVWNEFADWYLEMSKKSESEETKQTLLYVLQNLLKLLHPYIPYVTEEIWGEFNEDMLITAAWPEADESLINAEQEKKADLIRNIIKEIRSKRAEAKVDPVKKISAIVFGGKNTAIVEEHAEVIKFMAGLETLTASESGDKPEKAIAIFIDGAEVYLPLADMLDPEKEKKRIEKEIAEAEKYVKSIQGKLSNKNFVQKAPANIIEAEKEKEKATLEKIEKLKKQLGEI